MAYEFKKLSEVEIVESLSDEASVLVEDGGEVKRVSKDAVGGGSGADVIITWDNGSTWNGHPMAVSGNTYTITEGAWATLMEKLKSGITPNVAMYGTFGGSHVAHCVPVGISTINYDEAYDTVHIYGIGENHSQSKPQFFRFAIQHGDVVSCINASLYTPS